MKIAARIALNIPIIAICIMLTILSDTAVISAKGAVLRCLNVLIPSLFVFMALSGVLISSGAYRILSLPFYPIAKYVFKIPYELFSVILISNIAGFPIGAQMLTELVDKKSIDKRTASILQCFCYGGGPSFSVGVIGLALYGDKNIGLLICLSTLLANLTAALVIGRLFKPRINALETYKKFTVNDIIISTEKAGKAMLMICALVIAFCVIMECTGEMIGKLPIETFHILPPYAKTLIKTVFELSSLSALTTRSHQLIPLITALFSFGGVCVLVQVSATVKGKYSLLPFFATRLPISLIAYLAAKLLYPHMIDDTQYCIAVNDSFIVNFNNFVPSLCLILMIFLLLYRKGLAFFKDI